jgi:hypothetical protein
MTFETDSKSIDNRQASAQTACLRNSLLWGEGIHIARDV